MVRTSDARQIRPTDFSTKYCRETVTLNTNRNAFRESNTIGINIDLLPWHPSLRLLLLAYVALKQNRGYRQEIADIPYFVLYEADSFLARQL